MLARRGSCARLSSVVEPEPEREPAHIEPDFERFSQVNDVFSRSRWDETIRDERSDTFFSTYRRPLTKWRKANGFTQRDYAIRNASWHVADIFAEMFEGDDRRDGFLDPLSMLRGGASEKVDVGPPDQASRELKQVATTFGADLFGVTEFDERGSTRNDSVSRRAVQSRTTCPTD